VAGNLAQVELPDSFSPSRPNTKVVSPDGFTMDRFGLSVALSETTLAVGAPYDDVDGTLTRARCTSSGAIMAALKVGGFLSV